MEVMTPLLSIPCPRAPPGCSQDLRPFLSTDPGPRVALPPFIVTAWLAQGHPHQSGKDPTCGLGGLDSSPTPNLWARFSCDLHGLGLHGPSQPAAKGLARLTAAGTNKSSLIALSECPIVLGTKLEAWGP